MKWHGPVRYQAHPTHSAEALSIDWGKHSALKSKQGVYVKTIQTERGRGIVYVGTAHGRNGFQGRLELDQDNHKSCYLDGRYMLEDPEQMKQGIRQRVNYGLLNLELSMRGPQGIQREKLSADLLEKVEETHQFGIGTTHRTRPDGSHRSVSAHRRESAGMSAGVERQAVAGHVGSHRTQAVQPTVA
jgi:hypothetical protein